MTQVKTIFGKAAALQFVEENIPKSRRKALKKSIREACISIRKDWFSEKLLTVDGLCVADRLFTFHVMNSGTTYLANVQYAVQFNDNKEICYLEEDGAGNIHAVPYLDGKEWPFGGKFQEKVDSLSLPSIPLRNPKCLTDAYRKARDAREELEDFVKTMYERNEETFRRLKESYPDANEERDRSGWIHTVRLKDGPISYLLWTLYTTGDFFIRATTVEQAQSVEDLLKKKPIKP